jgi:hypothetical protein
MLTKHGARLLELIEVFSPAKPSGNEPTVREAARLDIGRKYAVFGFSYGALFAKPKR